MARKLQDPQKERLFEETLIPAKPGSDRLFDLSYSYEAAKSVECLGVTFPSDEARRAHFMEKLRDNLKEQAFRKIDGFPIGEDENILALSDPPYYTACPNPFLPLFVTMYCTPNETTNGTYHQNHFASDVSEGKNDPIYNAHSYHTKVPHKAIIRYILHYTQPGDVVFDGFSGTGRTGLAAQLCADGSLLKSLGYTIKMDDTINQSISSCTSFLTRGIRHDSIPHEAR
jgi:hypothetical protein